MQHAANTLLRRRHADRMSSGKSKTNSRFDGPEISNRVLEKFWRSTNPSSAGTN
jgi:hypothetical protein